MRRLTPAPTAAAAGGAAVMAAVAQESFIEHAESNVAATEAELVEAEASNGEELVVTDEMKAEEERAWGERKMYHESWA